MIIVKIMGGLGNQMFQYALYRSLLKYYDNVKIDISYYDFYDGTPHNIYTLEKIFILDKDLEIATKKEVKKLSLNFNNLLERIFIKIFNIRKNEIIQENAIEYYDYVYKLDNDAYLNGYWQSYKYFDNIKEDIKKCFSFRGELDKRNYDVCEQIKNTNSVSIHIRRGDYTDENISKVFGNICTLEYYGSAVEYLENKFNDLVYYIFSNDIDWCKENLKFIKNPIYIYWNISDDSYKDLQLMSNCKHNIIANSTFSWWGAWLNNNENKIVIAPKKWNNRDWVNQNDIIPNEWIRL